MPIEGLEGTGESDWCEFVADNDKNDKDKKICCRNDNAGEMLSPLEVLVKSASSVNMSSFSSTAFKSKKTPSM